MSERREFVLSRDQAVRIGDVVVSHAGFTGSKSKPEVKLAFDAPREVKILRAELEMKEAGGEQWD